MLQIIYTTVFRAKRLNNLTHVVRLFNFFNSEIRGINITCSRLFLDISTVPNVDPWSILLGYIPNVYVLVSSKNELFQNLKH